MLCNVTLLKTNLNPSNTRLFNSKSEQNSFFDSLAVNGVTFSNISFNGSRNFKLIGFNVELSLNGYNYCIINIPSKNIKYYTFIDEFIYINDNTYEIYVTLDYIQTYMFDIKLSNAVVKQRTLNKNADYKNKYIDTYMYYGNSYPFAYSKDEMILPLYRSISNRFFKYIVVTMKTTEGFSLANSYDYSGFVSVVWVLETTNDTFEIYKCGNLAINYSYEEFFQNYQQYILNISIVDYIPYGNIYIDIDYVDKTFDIKSTTYFQKYDNKFILWTKDIKELITFNIGKSLLDRSPYKTIMLKRLGETGQALDILTLDKNYENPLIAISVSPIFPNDTIIQFNTIDGTICYTIPALSVNIAYSVSEWAEYYSQHSASINDGLATKHSYDMEILNNKIIGNAGNTALQFGIGGIQLLSGDAKGIGSLASGTSNIINSIVAYENTKLGLEQESALLNITWQDIKNRPNQAYNSRVNDNTKVARSKNSTYIALQTPMQMEMIERYHNRFGYEINMPINDGDGIDAYLHIFDDEIKGNKFDYVEYKSCVLFNGSIPQSACRRIEQILEQGIYFWYTDDIGNYEDNY